MKTVVRREAPFNTSGTGPVMLFEHKRSHFDKPEAKTLPFLTHYELESALENVVS